MEKLEKTHKTYFKVINEKWFQTGSKVFSTIEDVD